MTEIDNLIKNYYAWLKDNTVCQELGNYIEITAPFLDRHNDHLQIYLKKKENGFLLTDGGETIDGLIQEGCKIDTPRRKALLEVTLNGYGVQKTDNQLQVDADFDNFSFRKHSLVQAMLSVNDMFYLAGPYITSLFLEDVQNWLNASSIRYIERISFTGRSGYIRNFDFVIPKSKRASERIIKAINNPKKNSVDSVLLDWDDTKNTRPENSKAYAFLNDKEVDIGSAIRTALESYGIKPVPWKQNKHIKEELAA